MTKPAQEGRAVWELNNQSFETFLPIFRGKPAYPRYCFVRFDRDVDNWGTIRSTRGCVGLIRHGFLPQPIRDSIISAIMAWEKATDVPDQEPVYHTNQKILVSGGPFSGFEGLFQSSAHERVRVLLSLFGAMREVEVPLKDIRAA